MVPTHCYTKTGDDLTWTGTTDACDRSMDWFFVHFPNNVDISMWPSWSFYPRTIKSVDFTSHRSPTFSYTALATTLQVVQKLHFVVRVVRLGGLSGKEVEWSICKYRLNWHEYWGVARGALITPPHRAVVFNHNIHLLLKLLVMELARQTLIDSANAAGIIMVWTGNQSGIFRCQCCFRFVSLRPIELSSLVSKEWHHLTRGRDMSLLQVN